MNMKKWNQKCIKEIWWWNKLSQKLHAEITIYKKQEEKINK